MQIDVTRTCEKCGHPRRIQGFRQSAETLAGTTINGDFAKATCACGETKLNELDRQAIEASYPGKSQ